MTTWTQAAKTELENYFQRIRPGLACPRAVALRGDPGSIQLLAKVEFSRFCRLPEFVCNLRGVPAIAFRALLLKR